VGNRGKSLKSRRREVERCSNEANGSVFFLSLALLLLVHCIPSRVFAGEPPIWAFDFRDVFYDIAFLNEQTAVVVGARGRVLVSHPKYKNLWSPRESGTKELLTCVSFVDERRGWAAGHGGVIIHTEDGGQAWTIQRDSSSENKPILDIQFLSPSVGYACGAYDTFLKTTDGGKTWRLTAPGNDYIYNGLAFIDEETGYLVGEFGTVLRTTDGGDSWEQLDLGGFDGSLFGITLVSPQTLLVFGIAGGVLRSEDGGRHWVDVAPDQDKSLFRGAAHGDAVVLAGATGTLLVSTDGGKTFLTRVDKDFISFAGVGAHPEGGFVCLGERGRIDHLQVPEQNQEKESH
jgi:photosystem II stability/assembly factor-like uncharacterized protein